MDKDRRKQLVELGTEAMADALLKLAGQDEAADDLVERMIAEPKENIKRSIVGFVKGGHQFGSRACILDTCFQVIEDCCKFTGKTGGLAPADKALVARTLWRRCSL